MKEQTTGIFRGFNEAQDAIEESAKDGWLVASMVSHNGYTLVVYQRESRVEHKKLEIGSRCSCGWQGSASNYSVHLNDVRSR